MDSTARRQWASWVWGGEGWEVDKGQVHRPWKDWQEATRGFKQESDRIHRLTHPLGTGQVESLFYPEGLKQGIRQLTIKSAAEMGLKCSASWIRHTTASAGAKFLIHSFSKHRLRATSSRPPLCLAGTARCWGQSGDQDSPDLPLLGLTAQWGRQILTS